MDEYRKEKRRRDLSDSDDEDDPFHNKSIGGGSPFKRNLNASPNSSTYKADSIAGRSRATSVNKTPVNITAQGGRASTVTPQGDLEFSEDVGGVEEFQAKLKELWNKRTALAKKKGKKSKKGRKGKKGGSSLKKAATLASEYDATTCYEDDKTSYMTTAEIA